MKVFFIKFLTFFLVLNAFSNNVAPINFKNLGFSDDSRVFMFGEYGVDNFEYYTRIYFVNTLTNSFLTPGVFTRKFPKNNNSILDESEKALYKLMGLVNYRTQALNVNPLNQGRSIYVYVDLDEENGHNLDFVDYMTKNQYQVVLQKDIRTFSNDAAFTILTSIIAPNGSIVRNFNIGRPSYYRKGVFDYKIKEIILFPREDGIVFVIAKSELDSYGRAVERYMVEVKKF